MFKNIRLVRFLRSTVVSAVFAALCLGANVSPAEADQNCGLPSGSHCYSVATYDNPDIIGVQFTITRGWLSVEQSAADPVGYSPPAHLNSELWFAVDSNNWIEAGSRTENDLGQKLFFAQVNSTQGEIRTNLPYDLAIGTNISDFWQITRNSATNNFDVAWSTWPNSPSRVGTVSLPRWNAPYVTIGSEFQGQSCSGSAAWGQAADMWVSMQTWSGLWQVPLNWDSQVNGQGCAFTHSTPRAGEFKWSLN